MISIYKHINMFPRLRIDLNLNYLTAETCLGAPHKPFLLLSVMGIAVQGLLAGRRRVMCCDG